MVKVGDIVRVWDGTHLTSMKVVKLNGKTFIAVEEAKSHIPGRKWRVYYTHPYVGNDGKWVN